MAGKTMEQKKSGGRRKIGRNFRINGAERSHREALMRSSETKYVRSGGPRRAEKAKAKRIARALFVKERAAERRIGAPSKRLVRIMTQSRTVEIATLKAAADFFDRLEEEQ